MVTEPEVTEPCRSIEVPNPSILYSLFSIPLHAQNYQWDWAVSGGGMAGDLGNEHIYDIKVGTDNNYYFIAPLWGGSGHQLTGQSLSTYNVGGSAAKDILLFSTTCDGTIRWSHVLGGGSQDDAYNLVLDSQNNLFIGIRMGLGSTTHQKPVYFSPTDFLPLTPAIEPSDYYKTTFLVKFSSTGQYIDKKALQGDVGSYYPSLPSNFTSAISDLVISNDTLHFIAGLHYGLHLDDNVTVPSKYHYDPLNPSSGQGMQYHLAKYDTSLNYVSSMVLPVADNSGFPHETTRFVYDEALNRYYLGGYRIPSVPFTYDGNSVVNASFLFAIEGTDGSLIWHRELYSPLVNNQLDHSHFTSLKIDANSNIYIPGRTYRKYNDNNLKIYDPHDSINTTFPIMIASSVWSNVPFVIKFNSNGMVQWVKTPTNFANSRQENSAPIPEGLALKSDELAFGSSEANFEWDGLYYPAAPFHRGDPALIRLDKQTGDVIGLHAIPAGGGNYDASTAVAVDRDGNYIVGGFFIGTLFSNTPGITPITSAGESDFFVAKLGAYACGTNSTDKFNKLNVNVYPNPTNDIVDIETQKTLQNYQVYNVLGQQIQQGIFNGNNQINLHGVAAGTYFVKVTTTQGSTATVQVVKK